MKPATQRAVVYTRVSTEDQAKEGYSIAAQKKACRELAEKSGIRVVDIFSDEGKSATVADRPEFQRMIDRCSEGDINFLLVYHTDRFARNELTMPFTKTNSTTSGSNFFQ